MDEKVRDAAALLGVGNVELLMGGGQKAVARCVTAGGEQAILKVIDLNPAHVDALERARREVNLLHRISHPNVVKVMSPLQEIGDPATAVAWLEEELDGSDLRASFATDEVWTWDQARAMALDVARGLSAMHEEKVVHRDLSPGNVMARSDGSFTVIDPGFGRHLEESTLTGVFQPGTPGYMTPEHVGARVIYASDVFGVGVLMYQALTGQQPIPMRAPLDAYLIALRDEQAPSIKLLRSDLDPAASALIDRCLQRQSGRRFIDAAALATALEDL